MGRRLDGVSPHLEMLIVAGHLFRWFRGRTRTLRFSLVRGIINIIAHDLTPRGLGERQLSLSLSLPLTQPMSYPFCFTASEVNNQR